VYASPDVGCRRRPESPAARATAGPPALQIPVGGSPVGRRKPRSALGPVWCLGSSVAVRRPARQEAGLLVPSMRVCVSTGNLGGCFDADRGGGVYEPVWAQPSIRDRRLARRHHDKGIQGSATMHPSEVGRSDRHQGQRTGSLRGPTPDRLEYGLLGVADPGPPASWRTKPVGKGASGQNGWAKPTLLGRGDVRFLRHGRANEWTTLRHAVILASAW